MKRTKTKSLKEALMLYLRENGLETPLNEHRAIQAWRCVVGEQFYKYTTDTKIFNQTLYVTLSSSVVRSELFSMRHTIVKQINNYVGAQVITRLVLK